MDFQQVKEEGIELQNQLPWLEMVAVGGTAAAMHAGHRYSTDIDNVTPILKRDFELVEGRLEEWGGWKTNRSNRPVIILGERHGVELGIRQQRRTVTIDTELKEGLIIPTADESLRIKAFLMGTRKATRDYLDVAALTDLIGIDRAKEALLPLNHIYPHKGGGLTALSKFASVAMEEPADLEAIQLPAYKGIKPPYDQWQHVAEVCKNLGVAMFEREMTDPTLSLSGRTFSKVSDINNFLKEGK